MSSDKIRNRQQKNNLMKTSRQGEIRPREGVAVATLSPEEYLEELEKKVTETYPKKIESLISLREAIMYPEVSDCFDGEDLGWIDDELKKLSKELECFRKEWRHKNHLYKDTLVEMEKMLETRERILNEVDSETQFFLHQPKITCSFAAKQAELVKEMKMLKNQMYESWKY